MKCIHEWSDITYSSVKPIIEIRIRDTQDASARFAIDVVIVSIFQTERISVVRNFGGYQVTFFRCDFLLLMDAEEWI